MKALLQAGFLLLLVLSSPCRSADITIGDPDLLNGDDSQDTWLGTIMVLRDLQFAGSGMTLDRWSFKSTAGTAGYWVTPLILEEQTPDVYTIVGIGTPVQLTDGSATVYTQPFGLTAGSASVGEVNQYVGFWHGHANGSGGGSGPNSGAVRYAINGPFVSDIGGDGNINPADIVVGNSTYNGGANNFWPPWPDNRRTYSASFTALSEASASRMNVVFTGYDPPGGNDEILTNFPALVRLGRSVIPSFNYGYFASPDGYDLRFYSDDGTRELNYEIETWNPEGTSCVWVQIPELTNNCYIWATWGVADNVFQPAYTINGAVWSEGFSGVWHLSGTNILDSTAMANYGTSAGNPIVVTGLVGEARDFNSGDSISVPLVSTGNAVTVETWLRHETLPGSVQRQISASGERVVMRHDGANSPGQLHFYVNVGGSLKGLRVNSALSTGNWIHAAGTWDGSDQRVFVNGLQVNSQTLTGALSAADSHFLSSDTESMDGVLDEVRVSGVAHSADWLWACYATQRSESSFTDYHRMETIVGDLNVLNLPAAPIAVTAVTFNARLAAIETNADLYFYWGTTDAGTGEGWANTNIVGSFTNVVALMASHTVTSGLVPGVVNYYTFRAVNGTTNVWAAPSGKIGPPQVTGSPVEGLGPTSARLAGTLMEDGDMHADAFVYYGTFDSGPTPSGWDEEVGLGQPGEGSLLHTVTGLMPMATYTYRYYATNAWGEDWSEPILYSTSTNLTDPSTLIGKVMCGYQGWFGAPGDGRSRNNWTHWTRDHSIPTGSNLVVDMYPDLSEFEPDELIDTAMTLNGEPAPLFSSYREKTVRRHFRWMKHYGIDGIFFGTFLVSLPSPDELRILQYIKSAAEEYERVWAMAYDLTASNEEYFWDTLRNDWINLVDSGLLGSRYLYHLGRPVILIWGFGFNDSGHPPTDAAAAQNILDWFHTKAPARYQATIFGGVPKGWRDLSGSSRSDPAWATVYRSFDVISPWSVGHYDNQAGVDSWKVNEIIPDLAETAAHGMAYCPVIWPGFSWHNLTEGTSPMNAAPRDGGRFYWRQAFNAIDAGADMLFIAMFDEVDEGTAIFKLAPTAAHAPDQGAWLTLDADGYTLPSDWYLRLAGETKRMIVGDLALTSVIPTNPGPDITWMGTPTAWLAEYGLGVDGQYEVVDLSDTDGDRLPAWQEYIAGTIPTNSLSVPQLGISISNGNPVVTYFTSPATGSFYSGKTRFYDLEQTSNRLTSGTWEFVSGATNIPGMGQWEYYISTNPAVWVYYRTKTRLGL